MGEGRGTSNAPNTRNPDRPASNPSRLDQFADDMFDDKLTSLRDDSREDIKLPETRKHDAERTLETGKRS